MLEYCLLDKGCWDVSFQNGLLGSWLPNEGRWESWDNGFQKRELLGYWLLTNGCWDVLAAETGCWDIGSLKRVVEIMASE